MIQPNIRNPGTSGPAGQLVRRAVDQFRKTIPCDPGDQEMEVSTFGTMLTPQARGMQSAAVAAGPKYFKFVSTDFYGNGFAVKCHSWDGFVEGTEAIYIAMLPDLWHIDSELMGTGSLTGTEVQYGYDSLPQQCRLARWTSGKLISEWTGGDPVSSEYQFITPEYNVSRLICALPAPALWLTVDDGGVQPVTWQEIAGGKARAWDRSYAP